MNKKRKLARKLLSRDEIKNHTPIYDSKNWQDRKLSKAKKQERQGKKKKLENK